MGIIQQIFGPKKNAAFNLYLPFFAAGTPGIKTTITIAAGDIKISKDGAAFANPATLPAETPAAGGIVLVALSASEMNADVVTVRGIDQAGAEWDDWSAVIYTRTVTVDELVRSTTPANTLAVDAGNKIGVSSLAADTITNTAIQDNALGASKIAANAITSAKIATDAITATQIQDNAITANKIAANAITSAKIATDAIGSAQLAASAVTEIQSAILSDATPFPGADIDATISSRASAADYTAGRAAKLDNLDVATSTRADGAAYTGARAAKLDNLDTTVSSRADGGDYTAARAVKLDQLDAAVSSRADAASYTAGRAVKLDQLDAAVSSRAAPGAAMGLSANAVDAAQITVAAGNKIADHTVRRKAANARAAVGPDALDKRSLLGMANQLTNKHAINGAQLEVYEEDDSTVFYRQTLVGNSGATPIVSATPV